LYNRVSKPSLVNKYIGKKNSFIYNSMFVIVAYA
jgi:hypothetical protein